MWFAWAIAVALLCAIDLTSGLGPSGFRSTRLEWLGYAGGSVFVVTLYRKLTHAPERPVQVPSKVDVTSVEELVGDWVKLERWLMSERPAEDDLIGHHRIARRLAEYLVVHGGTVGLVGPFGSGKTSVLTWIKQEVDRVRKPKDPEIWFTEQSCWGFEDAESAVQQVLAGAMETVGRRVDCFSLRSLPETYRNTFSAGGDWLRTLADLILGSMDPLEQFRQLSEVLVSMNARLVLIVEDLDRTTSTRFDRQEMLALLQRLRSSSPRVSFVLATGQTSASEIDFAKLCDHIEILPEFDSTQAATLIRSVRHRCLSEFQIIRLERDENPWDLDGATFLSRYGIVPITEATVRLLRTPRALKHTLRRTYRAWQVLNGEVDFDHLLAVNVLRSGAPEAFNFLLRNWETLHDDAGIQNGLGAQPGPIEKRLTSEWKKVTRNSDWDARSAKAILVDLLPSAGSYLGERKATSHRPLQGIGRKRYWLRIVNEDLDTLQIRDQVVLQDIADWKASPRSASPLIAGLLSKTDYVSVWHHFAASEFRHSPGSVLELADQIMGHFRTPRGARVPEAGRTAERLGPVPKVPAFAAIADFARTYIPRNTATRDWLEHQVREAMKSSLALVNDLYRDWASGFPISDGQSDRDHIRVVIYNIAREQWKSGSDILRLCHPDVVYMLYQLVFPFDGEENPSVLRGVEHWNWMGPLLLEALRTDPTPIAIDVAAMISRERRGSDLATIFYEVDRRLLDGFFNTNSIEVIELLASPLSNITGRDRTLLEQVVQSAATSSEPTPSQPEITTTPINR